MRFFKKGLGKKTGISSARAETLERRLMFAAGDVDLDFGIGGRQITSFTGSGIDIGQSVAIQSDDKAVVAGIHAVYNPDVAFARYNTNGTLDTTFGNGGRLIVNVDGYDLIYAAAVGSNGKIYAVGRTSEERDLLEQFADFAVIRLNSNGTLDTTFDGDGKKTIDFGGSDVARGLAIQSNGKVVVVGTTRPEGSSGAYQYALTRLNTNGSLDTSVGGTGLVVTDVTSGSDMAHSVAIDSAGRIVAVGASTVSSGNPDFSLARYTSTGTLDTTFGGLNGAIPGTVVQPVRLWRDVASSVAIVTGNKILVGGQSSSVNPSTGQAPTEDDMAILRFNTNGTLDTTFGTQGMRIIDFQSDGESRYDYIYSLKVQSDGKIVAGGSSGTSSFSSNFTDHSAIVRLNASGTFDTTFDGDGQMMDTTYIPATSFAVTSEFAIVSAGTGGSLAQGYSTNNFSVVRYTSAGAKDTAFGTGGRVVTDFETTVVSRAGGVALQQDGKSVVAGWASVGDGHFDDFALVRYNLDGSLDTTFGSNGKILTDIAGRGDQLLDVAIQADGKIVAVGYASLEGDQNLVVVRLNTNGSLDSAFGVGGIAMLSDFTNDVDDEEGASIAIRPDGKIVVAGKGYNGSSEPIYFLAARLLTNGQLDNSFDGDGKAAMLPLDYGYGGEVHSMALGADGSVLIGGSINDFGTESLAMIRFDNNGQPDATFDEDGRVVTNFDEFYDGAVQEIAIDSQGRIVIGIASSFSGEDFALARFTAAGQRDPSFGDSGITITDFAGENDFLDALRILPGGKILAGGSATLSGQSGAALAQYDSNGHLDSSFGENGLVTAFVGPDRMPIVDLAIRPNGQIVAGSAYFHNPAVLSFAAIQFDGEPVDGTSPTVSEVRINSGATQRSNLSQITIRFSEPVNVPQLIADGTIDNFVRMHRTEPGSQLPPLALASFREDKFSWNAATNTMTIDLTVDGFGPSNTTFLNNNYHHVGITVSGISDGAGNPLADNDGVVDGRLAIHRSTGATSPDFFRLGGDLDGDADVDLSDLATLSTYYGMADPRGDTDGDGDVDLSDLSLLSTYYGTSLPAGQGQAEATATFPTVEPTPTPAAPLAPVATPLPTTFTRQFQATNRNRTFKGKLLSLSRTEIDASKKWNARIDWGDGKSSTEKVVYNSKTQRWEVAGNHKYRGNGSYSISITLV